VALWVKENPNIPPYGIVGATFEGEMGSRGEEVILIKAELTILSG